MTVITLDQTKALLGLTDTTYDTQITAQIPIIDAKVKEICGNNFNTQCYGKFTTGSKKVDIYSVGNYPCSYWSPEIMDSIVRDIPVGTMLEGTPITAPGRIAETFYNGDNDGSNEIPSFELDAVATATGNYYFYAGINVAYQGIIAKGIMYLINSASTAMPVGGVASESIGTYSYTLSDKSQKIDGKSGMPYWFIQGLPRYHRG